MEEEDDAKNCVGGGGSTGIALVVEEGNNRIAMVMEKATIAL